MDSPRGDEATVDPAETTFATRGRSVGDVSVPAALSVLPRPLVAWTGDDERVAAGGSAATITARGQARFERIQGAGEALFAGRTVDGELPHVARPRLFGGFAFHADDKENGQSRWRGFPDAQFVLPAVQVVSGGPAEPTWLVANATGANADALATERLGRWTDRVSELDGYDPTATPKPGIARRTYTPDEAGWRRQIEAAVERIAGGSLRKVVLAQALTAELESDFSVPAAYARLAETYPDCFKFVVAPEDGGQFFGATPERLVTRDGRTVRTEALAGSTGRGDTPAEDEWLARELLGDEKNAHEHEIVAETIREQLEPFASSVSTGDRSVRRLATVQHLETPITAELADDEHVLSLVEALHPTPAVGGLPPSTALDTIRETEPFARGWYAAPVGWFDAAGYGSFAVALRSAVAEGDTATLFAGVGIVEDSDPDAEWDEVQLKYRPMLDELE